MICFFDENEQYKCFSNWYRSPFIYAGRAYFSVEQFMLYHKALLFRKTGLAEKIRKIRIPVEVKTLQGYPFSEFDSEVWDKICYNIVKRGVGAKFRKDKRIQKELLSTGNELIAACSPTDVKWGIGIGIDDPKKEDANRWKGKNYLGRILMEVREEIMQERTAAVTGFDLNFELSDEEPIPEWQMTAGELKRIPQFYRAIHTFSDTLNDFERKAFYKGRLSGWDYSMQYNMGGGLPIIGFYEMKQEVYDIAARLNNLKLALCATENDRDKEVFVNEQDKPLADPYRIHIFSLTWLQLLNKGLSEAEFKQPLLGEELRELGFTMDCGHSFEKKYSGKNGFTDNREFEKIIQTIDVKMLGDAILSQWRYWNHWSDYEHMEDTDFQWFVIALKKLAELTEPKK